MDKSDRQDTQAHRGGGGGALYPLDAETWQGLHGARTGGHDTANVMSLLCDKGSILFRLGHEEYLPVSFC